MCGEREAESSVTKRGQTVVPAPIRKRHQIGEGDRLVWLDMSQVLDSCYRDKLAGAESESARVNIAARYISSSASKIR